MTTDQSTEDIDRQRNWTPPSWTRHFLTWGMLTFLDTRLQTCWARMAMWKMFVALDGGHWFYSSETWWPDKGCFVPYDYCGKYDVDLNDTGRTHPLYEAMKVEKS